VASESYDSPGENQGMLVNGANATPVGLVGDALSLDGVDSYVLVPNLVVGRPEGTVECWFKLNTWGLGLQFGWGLPLVQH
jgi:hypothetical protein